MTPAELAVERDRLLEGGRTLEEVEAMQTLSDPEWLRLLKLWAEKSNRPATDHACVECLLSGRLPLDHPWQAKNWRCLWHRARRLGEMTP